jgi:hypothetical protein
MFQTAQLVRQAAIEQQFKSSSNPNHCGRIHTHICFFVVEKDGTMSDIDIKNNPVTNYRSPLVLKSLKPNEYLRNDRLSSCKNRLLLCLLQSMNCLKTMQPGVALFFFS